ncbi:MAG: hypothetical protein VKK04_13340, partial [Synechococcales bacterium]|nr:hypothetical protein [Synechococcales bacterium]
MSSIDVDGKGGNAVARASRHGTRWLLQGRRGFRIGRRFIKITTKGVDGNEIYDETQESEDILLEILQERLRTRRQSTFSLGNADDFEPVSFLEIGAKSSQTVCRIARYLSLSEFRELMQSFADAPNMDKDYTANNLISILGIPEQLALEIFEPAPEKPLSSLSPLEAIDKLRTNMTDNRLTRINPVALGTGFLVGGSHLMTNNHVVASPEEARSCVAQFNYVQDALGGATTVIEYELDPEVLFVTNPSLDYTLVQLKAGMMTRPAGF